MTFMLPVAPTLSFTRERGRVAERASYLARAGFLLAALLLAACGGGSGDDDDDLGGGGGGGSGRRLTGIEVVPPAATKGQGATQQFAANAVYSNGDTGPLNSGVTWASSAPAVATINANGLASALSAGEATITGTHGEFSDTAVFTVTAPAIESITVAPTPVSKLVGETQQFTATAHYSDGTDAPAPNPAWTSTQPVIASVGAASGLATALAPGATEIRATSNGVTGAAQMTVSEGPPPPPLPFKVGAAEAPASFLPFPGFSCLAGYSTFCERRATEEKDSLVAGAIAITGADDATFILVKTTNIGYFAAYKAGNGPNGIYDVRQRIARELERRHGEVVVPADHIVVTADHSHHAPDTIGIWGGESPLFMAILAEASVQAGVQAYENRREARLHAASVQGPETAGSYDSAPTDDPDREFRVLFAEARDGSRIATLMNYAPHATVLGSDNVKATGDWTAWAAQEAAALSLNPGPLPDGGVGIGLVGALGAMDWNKSGDNAQKESEARTRLRTMLADAHAARSEVAGDEVAVRTVFIREPLTQPILLANFAPRVPNPAFDNTTLSIERAETPPWTTGGAVIGTYAAAVRLGDVFISTFPGEPFPQLHYALRDCATRPPGAEDADCGSISGARVNFLFGGANDFLGYMVYTPEQYQQSLYEGALYLPGCDAQDQIEEGAGLPHDGACPDHWTLMVSPTIGRHIVCTVQNAARDFGFPVSGQNDECALLTAFDGVAAPAEYPQTDVVPLSPAEFFNSPAAGLVAQCRAQGGPAELCDGLEQVSLAIGGALDDVTGSNAQPPLGNPARAGVASKDASWHLGASAGQFSASGAGIARDAGFDPYGHSTRKVGADILGTRIHTRALVVEGSNGARVAVVANDLYLPNDLLQRRTAQKLAEHDRLVTLGLKEGAVTGITGANLAMTSSHSHTSPFYSTPGWGTWIFQDVFDLRFYEYMATQQSEAIIEAASNLKPVRMGGVTVHSNDVTSHTYGPKGGPNDSRDGTPAGQPYEYTTQQITVIRFDDISGAEPAPLANWVIFGVHPEWVWGEEIVNGDVTHAVMRMLDRETGAVTVMSQRETGSSGPHKDTRVHAPEARREYQESGPSGADRAARILTDTLKQALARLGGDSQPAPRFAPFRSGFEVAAVSQRFAPPATRPYPGVSNCNSERVFEGDVGIPILGFPDCFYDHTEFTDAVTEPFLAALPYDPEALRRQLIEAGVPIPSSYSATTLTAVEETAAVHLQVFKLGGIVATMSPTEQFTSGALNLESRLDKIAGNLWHGFDWACRLPAGHPVRANEAAAVAAHCARQNAAYPDLGRGIPGSVDDAADMAKVRAQIHNDAAGWELDPVYMFNQEDPAPLFTLGAESEPIDPAQIKGNFTHEEYTAQGYDLVAAVGMANDYWGYMPEYRDYRSFDHYRKALNGLGPHGADFVNTRLARMAAQLNGADAALPVNPLDGFFQAESARAEATALILGETARAYAAIYDAGVPADGGTARIVTEPAMTVPRFSAAVLRFIGGSNYSGSPRVAVERCKAETSCDPQEPAHWETYGTQEGEVQLQLKFLPTVFSDAIELPVAGEGVGAAIPDPAAYAMWRGGAFEWEWTASFEAFISELENLGARPRATPAGQYRFVVDGFRRIAGGTLTPYHLESSVFTVVPWNGITVEALRLEADRRVSFVVGPVSEHLRFRDGMSAGAGFYDVPAQEPPYVVGPVDYPDSYTGGISWITNERQLNRDGPRGDAHQQYCVRCTFRPWADTAGIASATVTVRRADGGTYTLPATREGERWVSAAAIEAGETAFIAQGGIVDGNGESNGAASAEVSEAGAGNRAPVADAGADFGAAPGSSVALNATRSHDPDRDAINFAWTQLSGAAVALTGANTARPVFTAPDAAMSLRFRVTVTDAPGASHSDEVTVTIGTGGSTGPEPFDLCDPLGVGCLRDVPVIGAPLADALGELFGQVPEPPVGVEPPPTSDGLLSTPLTPAEAASCAPDNSDAASFAHYKGALHEHSGYSDGTVGTTPADYFAAAKLQGLDFMGSSEHSDNALLPVTANADCLSADFASCVMPQPSPEDPLAPLTKWDLTLAQARAASTPEFTAFRGFEWTSDRFGHINVFFSRNDFNAKSTEGYTLSMESFYNWFKLLPEAGGGRDGLLVFNHPGREDMIQSSAPVPDPAYAFNGFQYRADADRRAVGVEVFGKSGDAYDTDNNAPDGGWYAFALDKGWHVGPVGAEDEHGTDWAQPKRAKTILIARDRGESALREAMFARRFYAVAQNHNAIRLTFTAAGQPMGARIALPAGGSVSLNATLAGGSGTLELVTRAGAVLASSDSGMLTQSVSATGDERWYFVRVMQGGAPVAYSAPVWIRSGDTYPVCSLP